MNPPPSATRSSARSPDAVLKPPAPPAAGMRHTGRYALIEQLVADDVRFVFGNPGTVEQGWLDSIGDHTSIEYILTLQESVAVAIADGYARAAARPAVVQLHSGVGLGNGIGMMYQAKRGLAPLVVLAGEAGIRYDAMDAQMAADLVSMARPVTKWAARVVDPASLLRMVRRAMKIAATPPCGPVFLALPADVLDAPCPETVVPTSYPRTRVVPAPELLLEAAQLLTTAQNPVIVMGDGVAFSGASAELTRVAELLGAPVWGANSSEVNMDQSHPQFAGLLGHMFGFVSQGILKDADAVLVCGTYVFPEVFPLLEDALPRNVPIVHIDLDAYEIAKNFPVSLGLAADPKATLAALGDVLERQLPPAQRSAARARVERMAVAQRERDTAARAVDAKQQTEVPLRPAAFMSALAEELKGRGISNPIIFDEALTASPDLNRYLPARTPGAFFQTRGGSLGVGIPGALGAKLAHPDRTVIGFTGDGGSMYTIQALWTAAHHRIGAKFVICNNHSYKLLKYNIQQYWREQGVPEREFPASFDLIHPELQFAELASAMGVPACRVSRPQEIGPAIRAALDHEGPYLIDLVISAEVPGHVVK